MDSKELLDEEEEQLYLLEVVVNQLTVTKEGILDSMSEADLNVNDMKAKKKDIKGPVRVKVKFFDFPTIEIEEEDFKSNENENPSTSVRSSKGETETMLEDAKREEERWRAKNAGMSLEMWRDERERDKKLATEVRDMLPPGNRFTSGKSCLFPMMPNEMIKTIQKYPLEVQVIRMGPDKCPLHVIGQAKVELGASFREAVTVATTPVVLPISAFVEERYDLVNVFGDTTGDVTLFVRLSCFGATIFTQFKQIQGDKGVMSKISEMTRAKKSACDKRKKKSQEKPEEEEEKRPPCMSFDEDFPSDRQGISSRAPDDIFVPVMWRNINEPDVTMQFCHSREPQMRSFDTNYKIGLANNESVNMNRMFPGISHSVQKYENDHIKCNVQCACIDPLQNDRSSKVKCSGLGAHGGKMNCTNLRSVDDTYVSENLETLDEMTARTNNTTSKAVSDLIDSDWELMVSGRSVKRKKPAYPAKANYNPLQRTANLNKPCPATADGRCRCPKELRNSKRPNTYGKSNIPCDNNTCSGFNETRAVLAGLPRLCDPVMQNLTNVMPPNIMVPNMGPRSNVISICNCPKVPDFVPPGDLRGQGNAIRCECSNILTSIHPAQMPYTCPGSYTDPKGDMVRGQVAPCPIKIPEIPPEQMPQMVQMQATRDQSLPSVVLSEDSSSEDDYHYVERKRHRKAKGGKKKKDSDRESSAPPKRHKKKKSINDNSERTDFDSTAHKMLEEELDFYENMVEDVKKKAKGEGDAKDTKSKKESRSSVSKEKPKADEEKKDTTLYRYTAGMYPGVHIGHKDCVVPYRFVPKNMGWLWNIKSAAGVLKAGRGWRPGAIAESVAELMDAAKSSTYKKKKVRKGQSKGRKKKEEIKHPPKKTAKMLKEEKKDKDDDKTPEDFRPTLHVHKKHGLYYVSMYPPKKEDEQEPQPIQFKIDPKHPDGPGGDSELYESEESSTNTEDSFQLDFVAPHTLKGRVPVRNKIDMQCQVSSENIPEQKGVPSVVKIKTPKSKKSKKSKKGKKKGKGKKKKGKKAKGKKGKGKSRKGKKPKSRK